MTATITGIGALSPSGLGTEALLDALATSRQQDPPHDAPLVTHAAPRSNNFVNAESLLLLAAARHALRDSALPQADIAHAGVVVSTRHAGLHDYAELLLSALNRRQESPRPPRVSPARGPQTGLNSPAAHISIQLAATGPNATIVNGAVGAINALEYAIRAIAEQRTTMMIVGAIEVHPSLCATQRTDRAPTGCRRIQARPFDEHREGPRPTEAAIALVVEDEDAARSRHAAIQARIRSASSAFSAAGDLAAASRAGLERALAGASLAPHDVGAVFAGASGSLSGDAAESHAIYDTFGPNTPVCAVKGATGDAGAASPLVQLIAALASARQGQIPASPGFRSPGSDIAPINVLAQPTATATAPLIVNTWDGEASVGAAVIEPIAPAAGQRQHLGSPA